MGHVTYLHAVPVKLVPARVAPLFATIALWEPDSAHVKKWNRVCDFWSVSWPDITELQPHFDRVRDPCVCGREHVAVHLCAPAHLHNENGETLPII